MTENKEIMEMMGLIRQIHRRMSSYYTTVLSKHDLTVQHYTLMLSLMFEETLKMNEIAQKLAVTNPAVTNLVDQLENMELITRIPCEADRRVTLVKITAKGRQVVEKIQEKMFSTFSGTFAGFDGASRGIIKKFYQTFVHNLDNVQDNETN